MKEHQTEIQREWPPKKPEGEWNHANPIAGVGILFLVIMVFYAITGGG